MQYCSGDVRDAGAHRLDICNLPYADASIDGLYACHVLMMLPDDRPALQEVHRVLKVDGSAILQVPAYWTGPATLEAPTVDDRLKHFRDPAIHRMYTEADYVNRLNGAGLEVHRFLARGFSPRLQARYSLYGEVMHIARKKSG
jgi:SAM-dependent methyltransferase